MGGEAAVAGHRRPSVLFQLDLGTAGVEHGLDRQHHPLTQADAAVGLPEVRDLWILVLTLADAVPDEVAHDRETAALGVALDGRRHVAEPRAGPRGPDARFERLARGPHQHLGLRAHRADPDRHRRVAVIAAINDAVVEA